QLNRITRRQRPRHGRNANNHALRRAPMNPPPTPPHRSPVTRTYSPLTGTSDRAGPEKRTARHLRYWRGKTDMTSAATELDEAAALLQNTLTEVKKVIVGQDHMVERMIVALLARGHCLIEGVPGVAKTLAVGTL